MWRSDPNYIHGYTDNIDQYRMNDRPVSQSVSQLVSQSVSQSVTQSVG